jgi:hypothetical protein
MIEDRVRVHLSFGFEGHRRTQVWIIDGAAWLNSWDQEGLPVAPLGGGEGDADWSEFKDDRGNPSKACTLTDENIDVVTLFDMDIPSKCKAGQQGYGMLGKGAGSFGSDGVIIGWEVKEVL